MFGTIGRLVVRIFRVGTIVLNQCWFNVAERFPTFAEVEKGTLNLNLLVRIPFLDTLQNFHTNVLKFICGEQLKCNNTQYKRRVAQFKKLIVIDCELWCE